MSSIGQTLPRYLQNLIVDMSFIADVPKFHKMCVKNRYYVHRDSWPGSYYRWRDEESNILTCKFVGDTVDAFTYALHKDSNRSTDIYDILMENGLKLRQGIDNLIATYKGVPSVVTDLNKSLTILDMAIPKDVKERHGILYPSDVSAGDVMTTS